MVVYLKKSKKCVWSDMSNLKRIRDNSTEVTVWVIGHFKDSGFYLSEV